MSHVIIEYDLPLYILSFLFAQLTLFLRKRISTQKWRRISSLGLIFLAAILGAFIMMALRKVEFGTEITRSLLFSIVTLSVLLHL